jgi:hypothetical protein
MTSLLILPALLAKVVLIFGLAGFVIGSGSPFYFLSQRRNFDFETSRLQFL